MTTTEIITIAAGQAVKLPPDMQFEGDSVSIRRAGNTVVLEPIKPANWPEGFLDSIYIEDRAFVRPEQGQLPPAPTFD